MKEYTVLNRLLVKMKEEYDYTKQYTVYASIVDKKGQVISTGKNSFIKTHPKQYIYNQYKNPFKIFLHAEIDALLKYKSDSGYMMIVARMTKTGMIRSAKPCHGCFQAIKESNIKKIFYTNDDGELTLLDENKYIPKED